MMSWAFLFLWLIHNLNENNILQGATVTFPSVSFYREH